MGPVRINKLMHHFGSVKRIREASLQQLAGVVGRKTAEAILATLTP